MTGAVEVGPGVLWPCIVATRCSLPAPLSTAFLGPKEKRHLLVCLEGLIALAAFTLTDLIRATGDFYCTGEIFPLFYVLGTDDFVVVNPQGVAAKIR